MGELLADATALEAHLGATKVPFQKLEDGVLVVPVSMIPGVTAGAALRWDDPPRIFSCTTMLPIPIAPERRHSIAAKLVEVNRALPASTFILAEAGVYHVARSFMNADRTLSTKIVDMAIATTRVACDRHFKEILGVATSTAEPVVAPRWKLPPPRTGTPLVTYEPVALPKEETDAVVALAKKHRPSFLLRAKAPQQVELVKSPWFRKHRILLARTYRPDKKELMVVVLPSGELKMLTGNPGAVTEIARAEEMTLTSVEAALDYALTLTSWTRSAELPERPLASFDEIVFRASRDDDKRAVAAAREALAPQIRPLTFEPYKEGWRLSVWLLSDGRVVERVAGVGTDGELVVKERVHATLPVARDAWFVGPEVAIVGEVTSAGAAAPAREDERPSLISGPAIVPELSQKRRDKAAAEAAMKLLLPRSRRAPIVTGVKLIEQPFFLRTRILQVEIDTDPDSLTITPPLSVIVARGPDPDAPVTVFEERIDALREVAAADPPVGLDTAAIAKEYALRGDRWTSEDEFGSLILETFDDIPWRSRPDQARIEALRAEIATRMAPPAVEPLDGGFRVTLWVLSAQRLIRRVLTVSPDGALRRESEVVAQKIETYVGRFWREDERGRLVPSG